MGSSTDRLDRDQARTSSVLPRSIERGALVRLDGMASHLVALGVTANAITLGSLAVAAGGAVLLGTGRLGWAAVAMAVASVGDALDGLVARRSGSASVGGAVLDASVDRYEEALWLGSIAVLFRTSVPALVVALAALCGSFMISYGSAKAEAFGRPVPAGALRRAERAMLLVAGAATTFLLGILARSGSLPWWISKGPLLAAVTVLAISGNASAVLRLHKVAAG